MERQLAGNRFTVTQSVKNLQRKLNRQLRQAKNQEQQENQALWAYGSGPNTLAGDVDA